MKTTNPLSSRGNALTVAGCLLLVAAAAGLDYVTGAAVLVSLFFLLPISVSTWRAGRGAGIAVALASAGAFVGASYLTGRYAHWAALAWNGLMEAGFFILAALALGRLRAGFEQEQRLRQALEKAHHRLDEEMMVVGEIQRALLPQEIPPLEGFRLAIWCEQCERAGGDYYDFFPLPDGRMAILLADVSGHGAPAAVVMAMLRALSHVDSGLFADPSRAFQLLNREMRRQGLTQFVTACVLVVDPAGRSYVLGLAGHPSPLRTGTSPGSVAEMSDGPCGPPLGVLAQAEFRVIEGRLAPGDLVLLYTDGVVEARGPDGALFGDGPVKEELTRGGPAAAVKARLLERLRRHRAGVPLSDDVTFVVVESLPAPTERAAPAADAAVE
jgi:serine phosphatase RsbU (regulator of sigma subunit)